MQPIDAASLRDHTSLGRLLSRIEREPAASAELLAALPNPPADLQRIGITGSPGVGKSTLCARLIEALLERGERVAVVAVDPTSPLSGGAVLGDRVRMQQQNSSERLFIRSLGSRGSGGGLSQSTLATVRVLAAAGYSRILIETVGVGQSAYDISGLADTLVLLLSPEGGDGLQMIKAGLLELGDIYAVNKSDRPGSEATLSELRFTLAHTPAGEEAAAAHPAWQPPVLPLVASEGRGTAELLQAIDAHREWLSALPASSPQRIRRIERELALALQCRISLAQEGIGDQLRGLAGEIASARVSRDDAAEQLLRELGRELSQDSQS